MSESGGLGPIMGLASEYKGIRAKVVIDEWAEMYETLSQPERHRVLDEIKAMSRENDTARTTWTVRVVDRGPGSVAFTRPRPWLEAIERLTERRDQWLGFHLAEQLLRRGADATDEEVFAMRRALDNRLLFAAVPPPVYDGDRPAGLTDELIESSEMYLHAHRNRCRMPAGRILVLRESILDRSRGDGYAAVVRETHCEVHEALAGETYDQRYERIKAEGGVIREISATEATTAPLIAGCPHCARCER